MMKKTLLALTLLASISMASADEGPLFTGPLLTGSPHTIEKGHINFQPYYFAQHERGAYNSSWNYKKARAIWDRNVQLPLQFGVTKVMSAKVIPQLNFVKRRGVSTERVGDTAVGIDWQAYKRSGKSSSWTPDIKLFVLESIPTGKYDKLQKSGGIDGVGSGSWETSVGAGIGRLFKIDHRRYLNTRFSGQYTWASDVKVKGINSYGGARSTEGKVKVGDSYNFSLGLEYLISEHWALAFDASYTHTMKTKFNGTLGLHSNGDIATMGSPSSEQFTLAPALEYNVSKNIGIIAGYWFSVAGRNSTTFRSPVVSININI